MYSDLFNYHLELQDGTEETIVGSQALSLSLGFAKAQPQRVKVVSEGEYEDVQLPSLLFATDNPYDAIVSPLKMLDGGCVILSLSRIKTSDAQDLIYIDIIGDARYKRSLAYSKLFQSLKAAGYAIECLGYHTEFNFQIPESQDQLMAMMELMFRVNLANQTWIRGGVKSLSLFTLNINKLNECIHLLDELILTWQDEMSDVAFYHPNCVPLGVDYICYLMKLIVPNPSLFRIPTDSTSLEVVKTFKKRIIRVFELNNYAFRFWSALLKPEFLKANAVFPEHDYDLINQQSVFYLIMNYGTRRKDSILHGVNDLTYSMNKIFTIVDFRWIANAVSSGYDHTHINGSDVRKKIEILDADDVKDLASSPLDFVRRHENDGTLRSMPRIRSKILEIIRNNPEYHWADLLGYRVFNRSSGSLANFFSSRSNLPSATIYYSLIFYFFNMGPDGVIHSPNHPTDEMKSLFTLLNVQAELSLLKAPHK